MARWALARLKERYDGAHTTVVVVSFRHLQLPQDAAYVLFDGPLVTQSWRAMPALERPSARMTRAASRPSVSTTRVCVICGHAGICELVAPGTYVIGRPAAPMGGR